MRCEEVGTFSPENLVSENLQPNKNYVYSDKDRTTTKKRKPDFNQFFQQFNHDDDDDDEEDEDEMQGLD